MADAPTPLFVAVGESTAELFGLPARDHAERVARNKSFEVAEAPIEGRSALLASLAFAWDPAWLKTMRDRPGAALTANGKPVMVHVPVDGDASEVLAALDAGVVPKGFEQVDAATADVNYFELRKRERPFVLPLDANDPGPVERALYDASYKGVTDALTLYLWRKPAFHLTRWAAAMGLSPNFVTSVGAVLCVLAFYLFWIGDYWLGVLSGFVFMVLDTVDGKLARCTGTSSKWGNVFDHGIDLVHPPFWYWAWAHGLSAFGTPLDPVSVTMAMVAIVLGYIVQRIIEGVFILRFKGMHIHVWKKIDSQFRLVTARRNPNMVILVAALLFRLPDIGLLLVAAWTVISLIFHAVRLAQAEGVAARGMPITSWLEA